MAMSGPVRVAYRSLGRTVLFQSLIAFSGAMPNAKPTQKDGRDP